MRYARWRDSPENKKASIPAIDKNDKRDEDKLRGTTQFAAIAAALNLFNGRQPPESLPEAPGRPSEPFANLSFSGRKALCVARFLIIPIKAYNYNIKLQQE